MHFMIRKCYLPTRRVPVVPTCIFVLPIGYICIYYADVHTSCQKTNNLFTQRGISNTYAPFYIYYTLKVITYNMCYNTVTQT